MKNNYNKLHQYILDNSLKDYHRETVNGLFRSVLEPLISNQKFEACIALRLLDTQEKLSSLKRLEFSNIDIYSFSDTIDKYKNLEKTDIWADTEFLIVIGSRYSACLLWDYSLSDQKDYTPVCFLYNSSLIGEIAKYIADNSSVDLKDTLLKFIPDRRENKLLNYSINSVANLLNDKNEEFLFSKIEREQKLNNDEALLTASIVADKAKFIAHEIKNNLSIVNLYSKIVQKRMENIKSDEETINSIENALKNIVSASENISSHISDLRCLSSPYKTEFNIKQSILEVVSECSEKAKVKDVLIKVQNLQDMLINSDRVKFECSFMNVIYNAIEACSSGDKITVSCGLKENAIVVKVLNTGSKIPEELQTKIFEPNFTTKESGNGLGLSICKKQLNLINGDINLIYSNDEETLFEITLIV